MSGAPTTLAGTQVTRRRRRHDLRHAELHRLRPERERLLQHRARAARRGARRAARGGRAHLPCARIRDHIARPCSRGSTRPWTTGAGRPSRPARKRAQDEVASVKRKLGPEIGSLFDEGFMQAAEQAAVNELATKRSGLDFLALVVEHPSADPRGDQRAAPRGVGARAAAEPARAHGFPDRAGDLLRVCGVLDQSTRVTLFSVYTVRVTSCKPV